MRNAPDIAPAVVPPAASNQVLVSIAIIGATIIALYFGRDILIPIALAALLSFALGPLVTKLRRRGLPRIPSVLLVVMLAFAAIGGFGILVGSQIAQLAENLPSYQKNIQGKIHSFQTGMPTGGVLERASRMLSELGKELQQPDPGSATGATPATAGTGNQVTVRQASDQPLTVRVLERPATPLEVIRDVALPLLAPIGTAGIVIVFVIFMLLEREDLRDRLIRLVSGGHLHQTTEAMNEAAKRVSRYLLMQLVVNATYGIPIGLGLWIIGVPNALLWGMLSTVLRFVPYVGPFIAALFPIALSFAVDPGWTMLLWTLALFLVLELISNNAIEPWLYGASTGISTVAILVAAIFWTTLWGPVGLLLSTPLTVCLAVLGRYVPQLGFLDVLLGSEPVLAPAERFYQRMLAGDPEEGEDIAEEFLEELPFAGFYDDVGLEALRMAEEDRQQKVLVGERRALVTDSFLKVVSGLADYEGDVEEPPATVAWAGQPVACIAGRTGLDRAAAAMLAQLLARRGIGTRVLAADAISPEAIAGLDLDGTKVICLSYLGPTALVQARQACRRLRRKAPEARILVGLWNGQLGAAKSAAEVTAGLGADFMAASLAEAVLRVEALAPAEATAPEPVAA